MKSRTLCFLFAVLAAGMAHADKQSLFLGDRKVDFEVFNGKPSGQGLLFLSLHSNEVTAVRAVKSCLLEFSGKLVAIDAGGERRLALAPGKSNSTIDPNRMFSSVGIERDLKKFGIPRPGDSRLVYDFGKNYYETFVQGEKLIVAVHNNTNGSFSILSYQPGGGESGATGSLFINPREDPDDFFLVTTKEDFNAIKKKGYNVVLQSTNPPDDGSLSVLCGKLNIRYINIESESDHLTKQIEMVKFVFHLSGVK